MGKRWKRKNVLCRQDRCPNFSFEDIDGKKVTLKSLKGKYIFIDIWATWCPPCRDELPFLKVLEEKFKDRNIWFVSISCDKDKKKWVEMVKREKLGGIQLHMGDDWSFMDSVIERFPVLYWLIPREKSFLLKPLVLQNQEQKLC